jgi:hypothetical protein
MLLLVGLYFYDANLRVYMNKSEGVLVYQNKEFHRSYETYQKYYVNGEKTFEIDRLIGKTDNSKFLGFKESVWKIKGEQEDKVVFVKGLMIEGVYERK